MYQRRNNGPADDDTWAKTERNIDPVGYAGGDKAENYWGRNFKR